MDSTLFMVGLILFAALYIGLSVMLFWALLITILALIAYLAVRYKDVAAHYPYSISDSLGSVLLIATTWTIFVIVGPKPIPFIGSTFLYNPLQETVFASISDVIVVFVLIVFVVLAAIVPWFEGRGGMSAGGGQGGGGGEGNVGVGA